MSLSTYVHRHSFLSINTVFIYGPGSMCTQTMPVNLVFIHCQEADVYRHSCLSMNTVFIHCQTTCVHRQSTAKQPVNSVFATSRQHHLLVFFISPVQPKDSSFVCVCIYMYVYMRKLRNLDTTPVQLHCYIYYLLFCRILHCINIIDVSTSSCLYFHVSVSASHLSCHYLFVLFQSCLYLCIFSVSNLSQKVH